MARTFDLAKLVPQQWIRDGEAADFEGFLKDIQDIFTDRLVATDRFTDLASIDDVLDGDTSAEDDFTSAGGNGQTFALLRFPVKEGTVGVVIFNITLGVDVAFTEVSDFTDSSPTDAHFFVTYDDKKRATVNFGNLGQVLIPSINDTVKTTYTLDIGTTNFLDVMLVHLGNPFPFVFDMDTETKRRLAELLVPLYRQKGICVGIENAIRVLTGFESQCIVLSENFAAWQLDKSLLGVDTFLYGTEQDLWTFDVFVNGTMTQTDRDRITDIINYMKPLEAKLASLRQGAVATQTLRFDIRGIIIVDGAMRYDQERAVTQTQIIRYDQLV